MTPFQAINGMTGADNPSGIQAMPQMTGGMQNGLSNVLTRAQELAKSFQNPQQLVSRFLPDVPTGIQNDPNQIINWLQQTGRVNPQMVQMAKSLISR